MLEALQEYRRLPRRLVIGLMSGTSADAADAALVALSGDADQPKAELLAYVERPHGAELRERLTTAPDELPAHELARLNVALGEAFRDAALAVAAEAALAPADVHAVGSHGQTIYHGPADRPACTLQIGEPAVIAAAAPWLVVADFRPTDVALGGEGAPLTPLVDWLLLRHPERTRAVQNIGGIANLTYLPAGCGPDEVIAFDTGPGNMVLDALALELTGQPCDQDGRLAAQGTASEELVERLLDEGFFRRAPPKSAGREQFGRPFAARLRDAGTRLGLGPEDLLATAARLTIESIARAYEQHLPSPPDEVILGGGGARNPTLREGLQKRLPGLEALLHEDVGLPGAAKEAVAFAVLADRTLRGLPGNLPNVTGAERAAVLGKVVWTGE